MATAMLTAPKTEAKPENKPEVKVEPKGKKKPKTKVFPGWSIKHPSFGALYVSHAEAKDIAEAKEVYRKTKAPSISMEILDKGFRIGPVEFTPADTEVGK